MKYNNALESTIRILFLIIISWSTSLQAIEVVDDLARKIQLSKPAQRIISLAPNVTELLFEAGAGDKIIGVVQYSNFPEAAKNVPRIGGHEKLDLELIISMKPDLVIGWQTGNQESELLKLQRLGFKVFITEPRELMDIASLLERFGQLAGTEKIAKQAAIRFTQQYQLLKQRYKERKSLRVFYQIWDQPLMTVNGQHLISDVMRLCGLENIFANVGTLVPRINQESVIEADPQLIVAGGMGKVRPDWTKQWQRWTDLSAIRLNALLDIQPDIIQRHSPRILQGAEELCVYADSIRKKLD